MKIFMLFLSLFALFAVAVVLAVGIYSLFRGGDFGRNWSNKLMRLRVLLQFVAIVILVIFAFILRQPS